MNAKRIDKLINAFALFVITIVFFFTIMRLFFGAEFSDEAYAAAETYMVSKGALPFVNNWSQMPGFTLLLAPFVKAYTYFHGGTDGIVLFYRFLSFGINLITAISISYLYRKHIQSRTLLILISIIYAGAAGGNYVGAFRGDRLAIDISAVGAALIIVYYTGDKYKKRYLFLSGVLLALSVLSHPAFVVLFCFYIIAVFVLCYRRGNGYKGFMFFLLGAAVSTNIVILYLAVNGGGIANIFIGIRYLLEDVTYFQLENAGFAKVPGYLMLIIKLILKLVSYMAVSFICFFTIEICIIAGFYRKDIFKFDDGCFYIRKCIGTNNEFFFIRRKKYLKQLLLCSVIAGICLDHVYFVRVYGTGDNTNISLYAMAIETLAVPFIWIFVKSKKRLCKYLMGLVWFPTYIWVVVTGIGTYSSMAGRHYLLKNAAFLLGLMMCFAVNDNFLTDNKNGENALSKRINEGFFFPLIKKAVPYIAMMIISFTYLFNSYTYVYRDESFWKLDTVVSSGPYKGMRTTGIRADGIKKLDGIIDSFVNCDDYVLAMDNDPFIYLMSEGKICTPCTWDQALYSYHFDQPDLYYDYFKVTNTEPTKIIYFNYGRDEIMSIDVEYKFNDYVNSNYHKIYENRDVFEWSYCNRDIICELLIFERN